MYIYIVLGDVNIRRGNFTHFLPREPQVSKKGSYSSCLAFWKDVLVTKGYFSNSKNIMRWIFRHQSRVRNDRCCTEVMVFSRSLVTTGTGFSKLWGRSLPWDTMVHEYGTWAPETNGTFFLIFWLFSLRSNKDTGIITVPKFMLNYCILFLYIWSTMWFKDLWKDVWWNLSQSWSRIPGILVFHGFCEISWRTGKCIHLHQVLLVS